MFGMLPSVVGIGCTKPKIEVKCKTEYSTSSFRPHLGGGGGGGAVALAVHFAGESPYEHRLTSTNFTAPTSQ